MTLKQFFILSIVFFGLAMVLNLHRADAGTADVDATASCGYYYGDASVGISIWGTKSLGESYSGSGSASATCGSTSNSDSGTISVEVVERNFLGFYWLSTESQSVSAGAFYMDFTTMYSSTAESDGSGGGDRDLDSCP